MSMYTWGPPSAGDISISYYDGGSGNVIITKFNGAAQEWRVEMPFSVLREFIIDRLADEMISRLEQDSELVLVLLGLGSGPKKE